MHAQVGTERLYGLDWLRIGAFALLIFYHIGMFFVPWEWHVKTARPLEWLELPMMAINPWRLVLLFVISGVASRVLLRKTRGPGGFAKGRSARLLIPLLAGMLLFVAPQPWAQLSHQGNYADSFWSFWRHEYFDFKHVFGAHMPTYNHLWFVAYLWAYTMLLAGIACLPAKARAGLQNGFDWVFAGWRALLLPIAGLALARLFIAPYFPETHALIDDPYGHLVYGFAFFFGVALGGSAIVWQSILRWWKPALLAAAAAYALVVVLDLTIAGESGALERTVTRIARSIQAWGAVIGLIGWARLKLNRDGPVRRYLTDAIFPYYIAHQTIIVLAGFWLAPLGRGAAIEFLIIFTATVSGCVLTYELGRRIGWLRPFIGLKPRYRRATAVVRPATGPSTLPEPPKPALD